MRMAEAREYFETVEEITLGYTDAQGIETLRQVGKSVLEKRGNWALVLFDTQWRHKDGSYRPKLALHRYRKSGGGWRRHSSVTLTPAQMLRASDYVRNAYTGTSVP